MKEQYLIICEIDGETGERLEEYTFDINECTFVYDGCHKIYIVGTPDDYNEVRQLWGEDEEFHPLHELPKYWDESCPLRFIYDWSCNEQFVRQGNRMEYYFY